MRKVADSFEFKGEAHGGQPLEWIASATGVAVPDSGLVPGSLFVSMPASVAKAV